MRLFTFCCLLSFFVAQADTEDAIPGAKWYERLQAIGAKHDRGSTAAQNNLARKKLVAEIEAVGDLKVEMEFTVKDVRWKEGVAEVYTQKFAPPVDARATQPLIKITRTLPFELKMDEESAATIEPGDRIQFNGTLNFHPWKWGAVGRTVEAQQMHTLNHSRLGGAALGTYTSADCVVTIEGTAHPIRWLP